MIPTLGAPGFGNCTGGYPANVFQFAALNGSVTERLYPYTGRNTTGCKASMVAGLLKQRSADLVVAAAPVPAYARIGQGRVAYMQALAQQPIAAFIGMDPTFQVREGWCGWVGGGLDWWGRETGCMQKRFQPAGGLCTRAASVLRLWPAGCWLGAPRLKHQSSC